MWCVWQQHKERSVKDQEQMGEVMCGAWCVVRMGAHRLLECTETPKILLLPGGGSFQVQFDFVLQGLFGLLYPSNVLARG